MVSRLLSPGFEGPSFLQNPFSTRLNTAMVNVIKTVAITVFALFAIALCAEPIIMFLAVPLLFPGIPLAVLGIYLLSRQRWNWDNDPEEVFIGSPTQTFFSTPAFVSGPVPTLEVYNTHYHQSLPSAHTHYNMSPGYTSHYSGQSVRAPGNGSRTPFVAESKRNFSGSSYEGKGEDSFGFPSFNGLTGGRTETPAYSSSRISSGRTPANAPAYSAQQSVSRVASGGGRSFFAAAPISSSAERAPMGNGGRSGSREMKN